MSPLIIPPSLRSTMNWTGGRLRRHSSYKSGNKKQNLKRPRVAESKDPRMTPLLKNVCLHEGSRAIDSCDQPSQQIKSGHSSSLSCPAKKPRLASPTQESSQADQNLAMIKHKLLEKTDWASVAAARPLTVLFPPAEALRNFGRRRKITNDDCERLGSSVLRPKLTYRPKHRGGAEPVTEGIQNLDIRINGQPVGAYYPRCNGPSTDTTSQSMLLDHESAPTMPKPPVHEYVCENIGVGSSVVEGSRILGSSSVSPLYVSSSDGGLSLRSNFMVQGSDQSIHESKGKEQLEVRGLELLQSADASPEVQEAWTPIRRRFTLDDQIRAEEERKAKAAYDTSLEIDDCSTAHLFLRGPFNPRLSSSAASSGWQRGSMQDSMSTSSTLNHSSYGWLPEPRQNIQRLISQRPDEGDIDVPSGSRQRSTRLAPPRTAIKQITPSLVIFGQSVDLDSGLFAKHIEHGDEQQQAQHGFTCSPTTIYEANCNISTDNYPSKMTHLRRPDDFAFSPNMVKSRKPTVAPKTARIYIDQACASPLLRTAVPGREFSGMNREGQRAQELTNRYSLYN
ncbi:hypothetical protein AnigIFM50267_002156 [Aspergillus niger]|nr:hypothetical protein AnigIFM50267_002156 [Aspergillus niger]